MVARFLREARAVNMIKHPNIVDIFEFGELPDGRPFYVMELLEGTDLRSILNERGRFPPSEVLEILEPVCSALQAAHDRGHRPPRPQGQQHLHRAASAASASSSCSTSASPSCCTPTRARAG